MRYRRLFDEPFGDSAAWSNYLIAQFARREVTVALSGEGGDEIFCGYPRYWSRIGARSNPLNRSLARHAAAAVAPRLLDAAPRVRRPAGICRSARRHDGGSDRCLLAPQWRESDYDYLWFYRQFWREDLKPLVAAALARSEYGSGGGPVDQGRPDQHGAFARGAAAVARSSTGRIHAERRPRIAGRPATASRQAAGSPIDGAAAAGGSPGSSEVGLWPARASVAQAPSGIHASGGAAA